MTAVSEETSVSYEQLSEIERRFDDVETQIIREQIRLSGPLYERRAALVAQIPNFWPLVLEQAPPEIDHYIQLTDSALILSSLLSISVTHFEPEIDPRSVRISFEFAENEHFDDTVLEKTFWWRTARDGRWSGLVSEPVGIKWKSAEKDLTGGLLDAVIAAEKSMLANGNAEDKLKKSNFTPEQKALQEKIEEKGISALSFFAWFGFIGRRISAEQSAEAVLAIKARQKDAAPQTAIPEKSEDEDEEEAETVLEIFPDGDELAVAFAEDLWPGAIKYFSMPPLPSSRQGNLLITAAQAQEQDDISDVDFESADENLDQDEEGEEEDDEDTSRPNKKRKAN